MYIKISYLKKKILSNEKKKTIIYNYSLLLPEYIYLLPKCKVSVQSYSNHAISAQIQQSDIQVLQQRSEQLPATPTQLG